MTQLRVVYHFNAPLARLFALGKPQTINSAVTLGRHCFVRLHYIRARHRAHEYYHSLCAHSRGFLPWLLLYLWRRIRYGYAKHPEELAAEHYADTHVHQFQDVGRP